MVDRRFLSNDQSFERMNHSKPKHEENRKKGFARDFAIVCEYGAAPSNVEIFPSQFCSDQ
jgi:hypothetical protein